MQQTSAECETVVSLLGDYRETDDVSVAYGLTTRVVTWEVHIRLPSVAQMFWPSELKCIVIHAKTNVNLIFPDPTLVQI